MPASIVKDRKLKVEYLLRTTKLYAESFPYQNIIEANEVQEIEHYLATFLLENKNHLHIPIQKLFQCIMLTNKGLYLHEL